MNGDSHLRFIRERLRNDVRLLHEKPRGRERALMEAAAMFRAISALDPEIVQRGELDGAFALFGLDRDKALRDPLVWGGHHNELEDEALNVMLGAAADILHEDYGLSRRKSFSRISGWAGKAVASARKVENWARGGKEHQRPGRAVGHTYALEDLRERLQRQGLAGKHGDAELALKERVVSLVRRAENIRNSLG